MSIQNQIDKKGLVINCRIAITTKCNLNCAYCLMKKSKIISLFQKKNLKDILQKKYKEFVITGGEPLVYPDITLQVLQTIKKSQPKAKIWMYSNGLLLSYLDIHNFKFFLDGINISIHPNNKFPNLAISDIHRHIPVRVAIWDILAKTDNWLEKFNKQCPHIPVKAWKMDVCTEPKEDKFILIKG